MAPDQLIQGQGPIHRAVVDAMLVSVPDDWGYIVLTVLRPEGRSEIGDLTHELAGPAGERPVAPDDSLFEATYRLDELFQAHDVRFSRARYEVEFLEGRGNFTATFEYPPGSRVKGHQPLAP